MAGSAACSTTYDERDVGSYPLAALSIEGTC
jgi:hypothetical protein